MMPMPDSAMFAPVATRTGMSRAWYFDGGAILSLSS